MACSCLFHSHPHVHYFSSLSPSVDCIRAMMFHRVSVTSICTRVCLCLGVALASLGCGLGEFTFLSLTAHFDKWVKGCLKERFISLVSLHSTLSQLTSFRLYWLAVSMLWSNPVWHGCNQSDKTARFTSFRPVSVLVKLGTSPYTHCNSVEMK